MRKEDFALLSQDERMQLLWEEGEIIAEKRYYECRITLFLLDTFFVEVFYNEELSELSGVLLQDDSQILSAYAASVSLKELENLLQ
jgi:hypothetical protein